MGDTPKQQTDSAPTQLVSKELDGILSVLVDNAETRGLEIGITLSVGGLLVSGILIGTGAYLAGLTEDLKFQVSSSTPVTVAAVEKTRKTFAYLASALGADKLNDKELDELEPYPRQTIHLKDAQYFYPSAEPLPSERTVFWRGRLSEVDGFSLGRLGV